MSDFPDAAHLASYAGLSPRTNQSGTSIMSNSPNRAGNKKLKNGADPRKVDTSGGQYDGIMLAHAVLASNSFGDRYPHQE
ncbi:IS110 family transposase, partial [Corynebacterium sp. 76QC2CO]|uniref:IS110 family transposase n=1 Tax=Corynebacterium kozikiae TaxID=2968469 RepID=UPI00211CB301